MVAATSFTTQSGKCSDGAVMQEVILPICKRQYPYLDTKKRMCSSKALLGEWAVLLCLAMLYGLFLCYEFIKLSLYVNVDSSSSLPTRTLTMKLCIFLKTNIYFKKYIFLIQNMMLTIPSDKPQIHYTMCKMEKDPNPSQQIYINHNWLQNIKSELFFFLLNCSASNLLPILFFSCILLTEKKRHLPGYLLIMQWAKVYSIILQFWTWGFSYEWANTALV